MLRKISSDTSNNIEYSFVLRRYEVSYLLYFTSEAYLFKLKRFILFYVIPILPIAIYEHNKVLRGILEVNTRKPAQIQ